MTSSRYWPASSVARRVPSAAWTVDEREFTVAVYAMSSLGAVLTEEEMLEVLDKEAVEDIVAKLGEDTLQERELCFILEFLKKHIIDKVGNSVSVRLYLAL